MLIVFQTSSGDQPPSRDQREQVFNGAMPIERDTSSELLKAEKSSLSDDYSHCLVPLHAIDDNTLRHVLLSCCGSDSSDSCLTDSAEKYDPHLVITLAKRLRISRSWISLKWNLSGIACLVFATFEWNDSLGISTDRCIIFHIPSQ